METFAAGIIQMAYNSLHSGNATQKFSYLRE